MLGFLQGVGGAKKTKKQKQDKYVIGVGVSHKSLELKLEVKQKLNAGTAICVIC